MVVNGFLEFIMFVILPLVIIIVIKSSMISSSYFRCGRWSLTVFDVLL